MHLALARKYRPRLFGDLIGQEHVARALRGAVEQNRVAHGYLLCGPRGVGKTTAARMLAMALNCETRHAGQPTSAPGEPCGTCISCERIWSGQASLDVVEIDAASNRGVDDARDLRERAMYAASQEGRHKIYIVDEAHMLTREAWNTLLKVLEEPPPGVVFVFATTEPHKITNTAAPVMSRLQRFDFRRVGPEAIGQRLAAVAKAEGLVIESDAVAVIARLADGGLRDALSVLDQVTAFGGGAITGKLVRNVLGLVGDDVYSELLDIVATRRANAVFPFVAKLVEAGVDLVSFAEGAGDLWRAALAVSLGASPDGISSALQQTVRERAADLAPGDLLRILRSLEEAEEIIKRGQAPRLSLEMLLVRWAMMDRTVEIAELLRGTGSREPGAARSVSVSSIAAIGPGPSGPTPDSRLPNPAPAAAIAPAGPTPDSRLPASSLTANTVRGSWPGILDALRVDKKMIAAEMLSETEVAAVQGDVIVLRPQPGHSLGADSIERYKVAIESAASRVLGSPVRVGLEGAELPAALPSRRPAAQPAEPANVPVADGPAPGPRPPQRVTVSGAKAERAKALRGKDPALDSAMDALDLELLD
jgi:DNA polymerase-3 subunit gamma/tau